MGIGASLFLIAMGAILTFGVNRDAVGWININVIGWILMLVGLLGIALTSYHWNRRRSAVVDEHNIVMEQPVIREQPIVRERSFRKRE